MTRYHPPGEGSRRSRWNRSVVVALVALGLGSCSGDKRKTVYPVQGKLTIGGQPAAGVMVLFHPQDENDPEFHRPFAITQEDGTFSVTTYKQGDGAPAGNYLVTLLYEPMEPPGLRKAKTPPKIPPKYLDPKTSGLKATVEKKPANELATFELP